jgi:hypothetical protein
MCRADCVEYFLNVSEHKIVDTCKMGGVSWETEQEYI